MLSDQGLCNHSLTWYMCCFIVLQRHYLAMFMDRNASLPIKMQLSDASFRLADEFSFLLFEFLIWVSLQYTKLTKSCREIRKPGKCSPLNCMYTIQKANQIVPHHQTCWMENAASQLCLAETTVSFVCSVDLLSSEYLKRKMLYKFLYN